MLARLETGALRAGGSTVRYAVGADFTFSLATRQGCRQVGLHEGFHSRLKLHLKSLDRVAMCFASCCLAAQCCAPLCRAVLCYALFPFLFSFFFFSFLPLFSTFVLLLFHTSPTLFCPFLVPFFHLPSKYIFLSFFSTEKKNVLPFLTINTIFCARVKVCS